MKLFLTAVLTLMSASVCLSQGFSGTREKTVILELSLANDLGIDRSDVPFSWGIPLASSLGILDPSQLKLYHSEQEIPVQFEVLARWGGTPSDISKPIAWLLVDAQVDLVANQVAYFTLESGLRMDPASPLAITVNSATQLIVDTGAATFEMSKTVFRIFDRIELESGSVFAGGGGLSYQGSMILNPAQFQVEHQGINRISLKIRGTLSGDLEYTMRIQFYRGLAEVKVDFRLENLAPPALDEFEQPVCNHYGCAHTVNFNDFTLILPALSTGAYMIPTGEEGTTGVQTGVFSSGLNITQESSGDTNWNALAALPPRLQSGVVKRASTLTIDGSISDGPNQIAGWIDANQVTIAVEKAWQNFPKSFRATMGLAELGLFPSEFSRNHELRPGEMKTHSCWVRFHDSETLDIEERAKSFHAPLRLLLSVVDSLDSHAIGLFSPRMDVLFNHYETGTDYQLIEAPGWIDEYPARHTWEAISLSQNLGWVDYGDIPTDFEEITSPYNLKYDALRGMMLQAVRNNGKTSELDWWDLAAAGARHVADIDILHSRTRGYSGPRRWFEGGMYGHGAHNESGQTNPHRNEMNPAVSMSGPAGALFLWAMFSGDTLVLDSANELAENIYWRTTNNDYWDSSGCGVSSGIQLCGDTCEGYSGPDYGRTFAHIIRSMMYAYLATGDSNYFDLIPNSVLFFSCWEAAGGGWDCNRFNIQTTLYRNIGHYLLWRNDFGLPADIVGQNYLDAKMDEIITDYWDPSNQEFLMCNDDPQLNPVHDNWLFGYADALALGGRILDRPTLISGFALDAFEDGSLNQFYEGSAISYHSTKEFVNQAGMGNYFLNTWFENIRLTLDHTLTLQTSVGGATFPPGAAIIAHGDNQRIRFIPDPGYRVDQVLLDGQVQAAGLEFTVRNMLQDQTLLVQFTADTCYDIVQYQSMLSSWPQGNVLDLIAMINCPKSFQ